MKDLLKYGLLGIGAYMLYRELVSGATTSPIPGVPATSQPTTTPPVITPPVNATTRQLLMAAAGAPATLTFHQWNWWYVKVRGITAPAPEDVGMSDGSRLISVDEYLAAIGTAGLSGLRWRRR